MKPSQQKQFPAMHRALHWLAALLMVVLFITGFLRMTWMGREAITQAVEKGLPDAQLTKQQLSGVTKGIMGPMWEWHEIAANIFFFVIAARIIYMLIKGIKFPNPFSKTALAKERLQGFIYLLFYLFTIVAAITGAYLQWGSGSLKGTMETIHKWAFYWFPIFIVLHFAGIALGEMTTKKGVTSKMIGGD
jgi:cytochrome b561